MLYFILFYWIFLFFFFSVFVLLGIWGGVLDGNTLALRCIASSCCIAVYTDWMKLVELLTI
ncbi:hypothetical protein BO83DRAFT_200761 [Aspergillus eucalypticola CBS 122712]|uniref:Uncharacterized protein n=1 Tax=Aspergillus eucalypticola (strain CBS 122712 / IBT 29274) TaxID=1448314 RepID=A0A317W025_ASPEC|nr:uncharacterized protein BO83DRAFT_200761 [Aspergillus eucalypticola CBS 122712]PWY79986.1 hypothetical protein BO83DRAFT_200761 [Aspergillus eucalypticola CBS 122712]